jgi:aldehyde dehydrogenase (NAD+)
MHEPIGVIGIVCPDEAPLLALLSVAGAALAMGNRIVLVPSGRGPLVATDFYQVLDTSDVPAGAVSIVTGENDVLARVLAEHDDVDALWYFGSQAGSAEVERASVGNLKRTWVDYGLMRDWTDVTRGAGEEFLHQAVQVKNVWVPFGA